MQLPPRGRTYVLCTIGRDSRKKEKTILVQTGTGYDLTGITLQMLKRSSCCNLAMRLVLRMYFVSLLLLRRPIRAMPRRAASSKFQYVYSQQPSNLISSEWGDEIRPMYLVSRGYSYDWPFPKPSTGVTAVPRRIPQIPSAIMRFGASGSLKLCKRRMACRVARS